ncbi:unnamed protein product [Musa acuminata subsp. burmannicoides]
MVNYWKSKVLPTIKKVFDRNGKKAAAAEACKSFDESKEDISKEFEEKKTDLQPKVVEIYEASAVEIKTLVKKPTGSGLKKKSTVVIKFIEELVKIEFPGSKPVSEAAAKYGPGLVSGPVIFLFEQVSTLLPPQRAACSPPNRPSRAPARILHRKPRRRSRRKRLRRRWWKRHLPGRPGSSDPPGDGEAGRASG